MKKLFVAVLILITAACASGSSSSEKELVYATGVWDGFSKSLPAGNVSGSPFIADGKIFAATHQSSGIPENSDCLMLENYKSGTLTIYQYQDESFSPMQSVDLIDAFIDGISIADIKSDQTPDIILNGGCPKREGVFAYEFIDSKWTKIDDLNASAFMSGTLVSISKDCVPSCADSGVWYTKVAWNGTEFKDAGTVSLDGKPVDLSVNGTCPQFQLAVSLPLRMCDEGPLVAQFISLVRNIDSSLSTAGNRFTIELAKWTKGYSYSHSLQTSPDATEEMFNALGMYWNPELSSSDGQIFSGYCSSGDPYNCDSYRYLFPTNSCPEYNNGVYEFPLRRCHFGAWVFMVSAALNDFDGKEFKDELGIGLFDEELETRVRDFQKKRKLEVDGLVGINTWRALLGTAGIEDGDSNDDGVYGPGDIIPH
jgi:hypothetical protein